VSSGKPAVPVSAALAASVAAVPAALSGVVMPAAPGHVVTQAVLDANITREAPPARPLVTRIIRRSARKTYTVISGDTLSGIAKRFCGNPGKWPALFHGNRAAIKVPDMIYPGQRFRLTCGDPFLWPAAVTSAQAPDGPPAAGSYGHPYFCGDGDGDGWDMPCPQHAAAQQQAPAQAAAAVTGVVSTAGMGAFQQCVIARESGGNAQVMNSTGHYGLYQFDLGTWESGGGSAADFGHAPVTEQNQVFAAVYAARGTSPWSPYDGC
jgi:LysM repeat protein